MNILHPSRVGAAVRRQLTAIGFAVLLSRPDPLRDTLLFVRYTETTIVGVALMAGLAMIDLTAAGFGTLSFLPLAGALSLGWGIASIGLVAFAAAGVLAHFIPARVPR